MYSIPVQLLSEGENVRMIYKRLTKAWNVIPATYIMIKLYKSKSGAINKE